MEYKQFKVPLMQCQEGLEPSHTIKQGGVWWGGGVRGGEEGGSTQSHTEPARERE